MKGYIMRGMDDNKKFKLTVYISKETHRKIGYLSVDLDKTMSELVEEILAEYFRTKGK